MDQITKPDCRKKQYKKAGFDFKLFIIDRILNGQISANHASEYYKISRSTIAYWMQKLSTFEQKSKRMSQEEEIRKLRQRVSDLEFIKELQQDIIVDFEKLTGEELSKKYLPETLANEIQKKKKSLTK